jgi:RNA polymerase sigma-70 factor (ECF subfamily)
VQVRPTVPDADLDRQWEVVDAFIAAAREGKFEALLEVLDPDVVLRADGGVLRAAETQVVHGAQAVIAQARAYRQLAPHGKPALVNGAPGVVVAPGGTPFAVLGFTIAGGKIVEIDILADPERLSRLDLTVLDN